ncbi:TIGR02391 family protein [Actinoplanes sp. NPDC024001]|uniref:TIGR02391 family protein n=1 Tax=Actinoplanes sp. NPDC024001 TaxID=3154598 RepID=UPI0033D5C14B
MRPAAAITELERLAAEGPVVGESWPARVRGVLTLALGEDHHLVRRFDEVRARPLLSRADGADPVALRIIELIDAATYELRLTGGDEPVDEHAYDPELWAHVRQQVEDRDWAKVASQTAIFVENHVRVWAGRPKDPRSGNELVGKALFLAVLGDNSAYRLGAQAGEHEGWRYLGMGFAQALSNVDRHHIQQRGDARRYALGVLGLGSLLLTQLRHQHGPALRTG